MITHLRIEINELCEVFLLNQKNCIKVSEIHNLIKYKEPILFKNSDYNRIRKEIRYLFPIHRNQRKHTKCFKISLTQVETNKRTNLFTYKPANKIKLSTYGITEDYFKKI